MGSRRCLSWKETKNDKLIRVSGCVERPESTYSYGQKTEVFVYISTDSQIIDTAVPEDLVFIDEEAASEGDSCIVKHSVTVGNLFLDVCEEGDVDGSESS
ncbi:unnamed protein product [Sphagnum balticum]